MLPIPSLILYFSSDLSRNAIQLVAYLFGLIRGETVVLYAFQFIVFLYFFDPPCRFVDELVQNLSSFSRDHPSRDVDKSPITIDPNIFSDEHHEQFLREG